MMCGYLLEACMKLGHSERERKGVYGLGLLDQGLPPSCSKVGLVPACWLSFGWCIQYTFLCLLALPQDCFAFPQGRKAFYILKDVIYVVAGRPLSQRDKYLHWALAKRLKSPSPTVYSTFSHKRGPKQGPISEGSYWGCAHKGPKAWTKGLWPIIIFSCQYRKATGKKPCLN